MVQKNILDLIKSRCNELGWSQNQFLRNVGYADASKAKRRFDALQFGDWKSAQGLLEKLPMVLGITQEEVDAAVNLRKTEISVALLEKQRAAFTPKALIITDPDRPRQITMCAVCNGTRHREIKLENIPVDEYISFAFQELKNEERMKMVGFFFGKAVGIRINYTFDLSKTFDLDGNHLSTQNRSIEQGVATVRLS